jgi:hypothetical protein
LHAGWAANISLKDNNNLEVYVTSVKIYPTVNNHKQKSQIEKIFFEKIPVYCLQVPSEVFYVRRNGKAVWTGNSRATGPNATLTRQPLEGRSREGGLRFGEMERDCVISIGASRFLKERLCDQSDPYTIMVCEICGNFATSPTKCKGCNTDKISKVNLPYVSKLVIQELNAMMIKCKIEAKD